ncbi:putative calcium-transporting ATPase 13, plasma membrane-type [Morella rubra]|uniref:Putative calcium-transporting ATPase 13, plasma membrane-type n=1 Tax=Morella rubra TaxID=262757 RepID=A0A6A1URS3_9ROSI|nr:putative calcium-transporting ATPase 13, plasma membrane-type [Morella rubra]
MFPPRCQKSGGTASTSDQEDWPISKIHRRRWRLAFTAIHFTRVLTFLSRLKILDKNGPLLRSLSYVVIDVQAIDEDSSGDKPETFLDVDPKTLSDMVKDKNFESLSQFGGVKEIARILKIDVKDGFNGSVVDIIQRKNVFGANEYEKAPAKGFLRFLFEAFKDTTIIILLACAILSLAFGIKQHGWKDGWYDGGSIVVAAILVVAVSGTSNFRQSRQFDKLPTKSSEIKVEVVRDGRRQPISIFEVVEGDIVYLKIGDQIPVDGVFVEGHSLKVDESIMTGESDHIGVDESTPFMLLGTKVSDGFGFMLVTSVGMNTACGEMMGSINREFNEETPLQERLNKLTSYIGKVGLATAALVLAVLFFRYFTRNTRDDTGNMEFNGRKTNIDEVMNAVVEIVAAAVTIIVVAIPEGLPLAVSLTLAYSMKRMMVDHAMVRKLSACETMGAGMLKAMDEEERLQLETIIKNMAAKSLRCIAFAHKEIVEENRQVLEKLEENGLTSLGLVGLKDPCWPGVRLAVESCRAAGVNIKMITGDNMHTTRAIAIKCGILNPKEDLDNEAVVEGVNFRNYSPEERLEKINKIRVMAKSSPFDKLLMVQCLKQKGHVVAVTGDGTNDAPALKEADIGLAMGIQGIEVAKESSDIVILDDNFTSVVTVLRWGMCVYNNIKKFLQFQLTVNVAALVINLVAAISSSKVPLTAVQLLWVNLIMDTLGALALATEKPTNDLMENPPIGRSEPLITRIMWRNLIAQALYQFLKRFANTKRLDWGQWGACVGLAALSWPIGWLVKCCPVLGKLLRNRDASTSGD